MTRTPVTLSRTQAAARLVHHHHLDRPVDAQGDPGARAVLRRLRMIQLDPLDPAGTNADFVALARVDGLKKGEVYAATLGAHAFEHFAKERCLLPADRFPWWRALCRRDPGFRMRQRRGRLPDSLLDAVEAEVAARGPVTIDDLEDRGAVRPIDWGAWTGTGKASTFAIQTLWTRCRVVVCGRKGRRKQYDLPERALGAHATAAPPVDLERALFEDRLGAAGLLPTTAGPWWGALKAAKKAWVPRWIEEGVALPVQVEGHHRTWLAPPDWLEVDVPEPDGRIRILGPLDPLIWDRTLVEHVFGFPYKWEVYTPKTQRRWGWYVCPLLQGHQLVGRIELRVRDGRLCVDRLWEESSVDPQALEAALDRHAEALGVDR